MNDGRPSLTAFPGLRLVSSCETERVLNLLTDDLLARRNLKLNDSTNEAAPGLPPDAA